MTQQKIWLIGSLMSFTLLFTAVKLLAKAIEKPPSPALYEQKIVHESDLNTVHLSDIAIQKLDIEIAVAKREPINATKTYGGDIVVPTGSLVSVSAPISGQLLSLKNKQLTPGKPVKAGELLYRIQPIITADARANLVNALADAQSLVNVAKSQVQATEIALNRAKKLLQDLVGSQRNVDDANAAHEIALRNLEAAHVKQRALDQVVNQGTGQAMDIPSPKTGIISNLFAATNQIVSAGNPIVEISSLNTMWVRVPIPAGDINEIDTALDAKIQPLSNSSKSKSLPAKPLNAPPTADSLTSSTHLYYAIENVQAAFSPAQRVSVTLSTKRKSSEALTIPWSAIVFDIYGGSWVYTQQSNNIYARNRVFLDHVSGNLAILSEGPKEGSKVVVNGVLELFAVETGFSH